MNNSGTDMITRRSCYHMLRTAPPHVHVMRMFSRACISIHNIQSKILFEKLCEVTRLDGNGDVGNKQV